MKKVGKFFVLALALAFFIDLSSAALGISPAKVEIDFVPSYSKEISFEVFSDTDEDLELYVEGDLAEYVTLDKEKIKGSGSFRVSISLPEEIEKPGKHDILIGVREVPDEDQFIGANINLRALVRVFVPYPGRYAEATLSIPDGNIDDKIPVEVYVINRGKESLPIYVNVEFSTNDNVVYNMPFSSVLFEPTEDRYFRKFLVTRGFEPGDYLARAIVDYGNVVEVNETFRVGSLFVNITNFTTELESGGIQRFLVDVESLWNGDIDEVFADVNLTKGGESLEFRTPSVELKAWEKKSIEGFLDTSNLEGEYQVEVVLNYEGEQTKSSGVLLVSKSNLGFVFIAGGAVLLIVIGAAVFFILRRKKNFEKEYQE